MTTYIDYMYRTSVRNAEIVTTSNIIEDFTVMLKCSGRIN